MSKRKYTLRKKIQYELDDFISKGFWAQLALLVGCVLFFVFVFAIILMLFAQGEDFRESLWTSLMHIIDQGTITGDETNNHLYLFFMLGITFLGMAFTSAIIGIIGNAIQQKMSELNKGHSRIVEKNHVVVLGFNENTHTIRHEIEESNDKKRGNHTLVIVDGMSKEEMEHQSRELNWSRRDPGEDEDTALKKEKKTTTLFRSGDLVSENTFVMCAVDRARAVIVNGDDDFETIRILLALSAYLKKMNAYISNDRMPSVVAVIRKSSNLTAAKIAVGVLHDSKSQETKQKNEHKVRIMYFREILAKIFAQVCVQPGLSLVMSDLLNYSNASFYIEDKTGDTAPGLQDMMIGKNIVEITRSVCGAVPVGFAGVDETGQSRVVLNPGPDVRYSASDMLIYLADDGEELSLASSEAVSPLGEPAAAGGHGESEMRNFLIMGRSSALPRLLTNMNEYCEEGSHIDIITPMDVEYDDDNMAALDGRDIIADDPYNWEHTRKHLEEHSYWFDKDDERHLTNMVILGKDGVEDADADEKVMVLLLNMRNYLRKNCDFGVCITTEVRQPQNQALVQGLSVNDFVVGSQVANRFMVQVAEDPKKYYIFEELLKHRGKNVVLKPFSDYVDTSKPFNYEGIIEQVFTRTERTGRNEIPMGWIQLNLESTAIDTEDQFSKQLVLNPTIEERSTVFRDDENDNFDDFRLILLADRAV